MATRVEGLAVTEIGAPTHVTAFNDFYRREYPAVAAVTTALCGDRSSGEDLAQEAFVRAYHRWNQVGGYERPGAWVRRVAINLATSRHRRALTEARGRWRMTERPTTDLPLPDEALWAAVRRLPHRQRQAVVLTYVDDLSIEEAAAAMGCAPGSVKAHLHRARQTLASQLAERHEEESR